jgi:pimeloyl-ACP methyl ester carboxylesterase
VHTTRLERNGGTIAFDDTGGDGPLMMLVPGAGDVRSEYRHLAPHLTEAGIRVVTVDLRGHGESSTDWESYGVAETADDLVAVIDSLDAGPVTVIGTSFAPAAALWAAADRPDLIDRLVLISPHLEAAPMWQTLPLRLLVRGPFAGALWTSRYRKWHPAAPPADLDDHLGALEAMMRDSGRRRAVRETLTAHRNDLAERIENVTAPTLVVMGGADSHFADPETEGASIAARTNGRLQVVPGAGHYPHVEFPDDVAEMIVAFLAETRP